ncbi:hypothetical protein KP509_07G006900 [Ceratopteris richardii]|uniref:Phytocyanin domain-containing protein n=1 Tax=Ceratopteris richardii TaxID=49495 RepID=A0A8T2UEZ8_CERRI|nr:hypothetical protein KP509_07G006900 [Ceratopteris richardii]
MAAGQERGNAATGAMMVAMTLLGLCSVIKGVMAVNYVVGDSQGWTIMHYDSWLTGKTFRVGDTLEFKYNRGAHDVVEVTAAEYGTCTKGSESPYTDGDTKINLDTAGTRYFICSISGHCGAGMKLSIDVVAAASTTPSSSPTAKTPASSPSTPDANAPTPSSSSNSTASKENSAVFFAPSLWILSFILGFTILFIR